MSTELTLQIDSIDSEASEKIGQRLGARLKGGEVIDLVSDLGGGKTTLVRGIAEGAGSTDHVSSPTFTISNIYKTKNLQINHFDFYRLHEAGLMEHELGDLLGDKHQIAIIEWADVVKHVLPDKRLTIHIKTTGETSRQFTFHCPKSLSYLIDGQT